MVAGVHFKTGGSPSMKAVEVLNSSKNMKQFIHKRLEVNLEI